MMTRGFDYIFQQVIQFPVEKKMLDRSKALWSRLEVKLFIDKAFCD
jgi:hypothetical protein